MASNPRIPPQNLEAERAVIGSILIDSESVHKVIDKLRAEYFYDHRNVVLFGAIQELSQESSAIDVLTVSSKLKKKKKFKEVGGGVYLSEVTESVPTSSNIDYYAGLVKEAAIRRNLIELGVGLDAIARDEAKSLDEIVDEVETKMLGVSKDSVKQEYFDTNQLIKMQIELADEYAKNKNSIRGIATGLENVDNLLHGFHRSDLVILAARPSVGKSALAFNFARYASVDLDYRVLVFSLEMTAVQVFERMLAQQIDSKETSLWDLRMGSLKNTEYPKYNEALQALGGANVFIDETPGINVTQIRSKSRKLMLEKGLDMIIVDYLQLMQTREIDNRATAVGEISRSLKILARELKVPVIALSQLNRALETRSGSDKIPQLSDLRESGSIEQDADVVMFLHRDVPMDEQYEGKEDTDIDLVVAKHRNGPIGKCKLVLSNKQQKFRERTSL